MPKFKITMSQKSDGQKVEKIMEGRELQTVITVAKMIFEEFEDIEVEEIQSIYDRQIISSVLPTGREVELQSFSFHLTYGNMIEGDPDREGNEQILGFLKRKFEKDEVPTYIHQPSDHVIHNELPLFYGIAYWKCYKKMVPEKWSSELRIIWFMESVDQVNFRELLGTSLLGVDWEKYAVGYDPGDL